MPHSDCDNIDASCSVEEESLVVGFAGPSAMGAKESRSGGAPDLVVARPSTFLVG